MALIIKSKPKPVEQEVQVVGAELSAHVELIDEVGELALEMLTLEARLLKIAGVGDIITKQAALKKKHAAKVKELQKLVTEELSDQNADEAYTPLGGKYQVEAGKAVNSRAITDMPMLKALMDDHDPELFLKLCQMTLKSVDDYLTPEEKELVLTTTRGLREIKVVKRV